MQQHSRNTAVVFAMLPKPPVPPNIGDDDDGLDAWPQTAANYIDKVWQLVEDLPPIMLALPSKVSDSQIFTTSL
jgi:hypothetical protein